MYLLMAMCTCPCEEYICLYLYIDVFSLCPFCGAGSNVTSVAVTPYCPDSDFYMPFSTKRNQHSLGKWLVPGLGREYPGWVLCKKYPSKLLKEKWENIKWHRSPCERTPTGQIWNNLDIIINMGRKGLLTDWKIRNPRVCTTANK